MKTFLSPWIFLAFISLNKVIMTKLLKTIVKCWDDGAIMCWARAESMLNRTSPKPFSPHSGDLQVDTEKIFVLTVEDESEDDYELVDRLAQDVFHHCATHQRLIATVGAPSQQFLSGQLSGECQ